MKEFEFKHNSNGTITVLRLKNNKKADIPHLLADVTKRLPPEVRRYMEQIKE